MEAKVSGIDLSTWNGSVDFKRVKAAGIQFAILREGYRDTIDSRFVEYVKGANNAGLPILGVYHFIYVDGATPADNAQATLDSLRQARLDPADIWIFADLEYDTWTKAKEPATRQKCTAYVKEYLETLKAAGCTKLGIYLNRDYYVNYYDWDELAGYALWYACYDGEPGVECMIQQTSGSGKVDGIQGDVDLDVLIEGGNTMGKKPTAQQTLSAFEYWLGYCEKASSAYSNTRDKNAFTKNAGSNNYTYAGYICGLNGPAAAWCAMQVSLSIYEACGCDKATAKEVMYGVWPYSACNQLYDAAPANRKGRRGNWTPQPGDVIVFSDNGSTRTHTGMVTGVDNNNVYTIEGNKGNKVSKCAYKLTDKYIWGYVRPDYANGAKWEVVGKEKWKFHLADGSYATSAWVAGNGVWYYVGADGIMLHNGLTAVPESKCYNADGSDAGTSPAGYFYLQPDSTHGTIGASLSGTIEIRASDVPEVQAVNVGVFEDAHNGHYGAMKTLNGEKVQGYTELPKSK